MKGQTYVILTFVFVILIAIFAVTNVESVEVNYFFWKRESPLILLILFSVLMGGLATMVAGSVKYINLKRENKQLSKELQQLKAKLGYDVDAVTQHDQQDLDNETSDIFNDQEK